jgi:NAD(P)-dependent dehydrogenase (short-subunit alcohol dehydrogenase family)
MDGAVRKKVAVIVGGASGVGAALCRLLASQHAHVIIADSALIDAQHLAKELSAEAMFVDVSSRESVEEMMRSIVGNHRRIDILVNSAATLVNGSASEFTDEEWDRVIKVNTFGTVFSTMSVYRQMVSQGSGHIVNIASLSGLNPQPFFLPYVTSKCAVIGLSLALRAEAAPLGVKVSVVCPGNVATPMLARLNLEPKRSWLMPTITAEYAARRIMRGAHRNRAVIVFPMYALVLWWLERFVPWLSSALRSAIVRRALARKMPNEF